MDEKAEKIITDIQILTDKLALCAKHPDEFVTVNDLQEELHKVRKAFEAQINNEGLDRKG